MDARAAVLDLIAEIAPEIDIEAVPDDEDLRDAVDLDSLDFLTLVERVHETTGVDVPENDYDQVRTLRGWSDYLVARAG
ncbi:acyl carrier protein [Longivirga aurantiaca]|uniref:Acyl carrier protein n=1 Tax=Longivirga aurantiaca TaxID=1837743 RepID=A0ABW1T025_9ACTN